MIVQLSYPIESAHSGPIIGSRLFYSQATLLHLRAGLRLWRAHGVNDSTDEWLVVPVPGNIGLWITAMR